MIPIQEPISIPIPEPISIPIPEPNSNPNLELITIQELILEQISISQPISNP